MKTYNNFIKSIKEGSIITHDIFQAENVIKKYLLKLNLKNNITIKGNNILEVDIIYNNFDKILIDNLLDLFNNLGYFPSLIYIKNKNMSNQYLFKYDTLINDLNKKIINIKFILESTFDKKIENTYDSLYHVTRLSYIEKIKENGLVAKSKDKISYHPSRIYLSFDIENCNHLIKKFQMNDLLNPNKYIDSKNKKGFNIKYYDLVILKINSKNLNIVLYKDSRLVPVPTK